MSLKLSLFVINYRVMVILMKFVEKTGCCMGISAEGKKREKA